MDKSLVENCAKVDAKKVNANSKYIKVFFIENYDPHLSHFPSRICASCSVILYACARGNFHRIPNVPKMPTPAELL